MTDSHIGLWVETGNGKSMVPADGEWKKIPGVSDYEWSHRGKVRSLPRTKNGRFYEGTDPMKLRADKDGYRIVNYTDDDGVRHCGASVARMILLAHDPDGYAPGLEACHGDGGKGDNRWPENIRWDTPGVNREEALATRRANRPLRTCPRCGREHRDPGQRCHPCVVEIGEQAALRLADGEDLEEAAKALDYPTPTGLLRLARKHGGLRMYAGPVVLEGEANAALRELHHPESRRRFRLRRVIFRRGASRPDSDAR